MQSCLQHVAQAHRIFINGGTGFPVALAAELQRDPELLRGKHVVCSFVSGFNHRLPRVLDGRLDVTFVEPGLLKREEACFVPMQYRRIFDWVRASPFDLAIFRAVRAKDGGLQYGMGVDFQVAASEAAKGILVEVEEEDGLFVEDAPRVMENLIVGRCEAISRPPFTATEPSSTALSVGKNVAALVRDGDCIQVGIGAIPDAVLLSLKDHQNLGCHSGMISQGVADLAEAGVLNGSMKTLDSGRVVTGFVFGDRRLEQWAATSGAVALRPVNYTHDARVLASIDNLVSINSAIEVDLQGQVNAEMIGDRQVSGTGGSVDFARGAALSLGGRSIVALPATAKGQQRSRIVRSLGSGSRATLLRTDVDTVVTEYGVAQLSGCDLEERKRNLAAVAAPQFREGLLQ